ncbi:MAG: ArdC family protein [Candidatus Methylacidiphilales bacterium]
MKNADVYELVTQRMIELLEKGVVPWQSPYFSKTGFPRNFATGKPYRGINVFLLGSLRFTSPYFLTFIQAKELGGYVRKGEKGFMVVKYGTFSKEVENETTHETKEEERHYLKIYTVFHASQIEEITFPEPEALPEVQEDARCDRAREIVENMPNPPAIKEGKAIPCYIPKQDCVWMPERRYFTSEEARFSVLFHELIHSVGSEKRLARKSLMENKGMDAGGEARKVYAEEEICAEMGASFLNAHAGINGEVENSAAYLQGWVSALKTKDAKGWIIRAASHAQKAAEYILNNGGGA